MTTPAKNGASSAAELMIDPIELREYEPDANPAPEEGEPRPSHRILRNFAVLLSSQMITWGLTALWTIIVPRALGPSGLGLIATATSVCSIVGLLLSLGFPTYVIREFIRDPDAGPRLFGTGLVLKLLLAPLMGLILVVFADIAHYGPEARVVLYLAGVMTLFQALGALLQGVFYATENMQYVAYSNVILKGAQCIAGILMVLIGFRTVGIIANMAAMAGLVVLLNLIWLRRFLRLDLRTSPGALFRMSKESFVFLAGALFGTVYLWVDTVMLSLMTSHVVVGWYAAATTLFQTLLFLPLLLSGSWFPRLVATQAQEGNDGLMRLAAVPVELILVLCVPMGVGTAMFAHVLMVGFYGHAYSSAVPAMVALAVCIPPMSMNIVLGQVAVAAGRQKVWTWLMLVAAFVNPAINLILINYTQSHQHNGAIGAGWAMVATETFLDAIGIFIVGRHVLTRRGVARLARTTLAAGVMLIVHKLLASDGQAIALTAGVVSLFLAALVLRVLTDQELKMVRDAVGLAVARIRGRTPQRD